MELTSFFATWCGENPRIFPWRKGSLDACRFVDLPECLRVWDPLWGGIEAGRKSQRRDFSLPQLQKTWKSSIWDTERRSRDCYWMAVRRKKGIFPTREKSEPPTPPMGVSGWKASLCVCVTNHRLFQTIAPSLAFVHRARFRKGLAHNPC